MEKEKNKHCNHHWEYVKTVQEPIGLDTSGFSLVEKDLVICTKCGNTKRV